MKRKLIQWDGRNEVEIEEFLKENGFDSDIKITKSRKLDVGYKHENGVVWDYPFNNMLKKGDWLIMNSHMRTLKTWPFISMDQDQMVHILSTAYYSKSRVCI